MISCVTCAVFFGSIYLTGQLLYRMLGQKSEMERVQELSRQHMPAALASRGSLRRWAARNECLSWYGDPATGFCLPPDC